MFRNLVQRNIQEYITKRYSVNIRGLIHPIKALSVFNRHEQLLTELLERLVRREIQPVEADGETQYRSRTRHRQTGAEQTDRSLTRCALGAVCPSCPTVQ